MTTTTHFYITDGHEWAGWNKLGTTHRVSIMQQGQCDLDHDFHSRADALDMVKQATSLLAMQSAPYKAHDLTVEGKAMQRYRDGRSIHVATLKRWKAALRSTTGNPRMVVRFDMGETEVQRDKVELAVRMARQALAGLRMNREA